MIYNVDSLFHYGHNEVCKKINKSLIVGIHNDLISPNTSISASLQVVIFYKKILYYKGKRLLFVHPHSQQAT